MFLCLYHVAGVQVSIVVKVHQLEHEFGPVKRVLRLKERHVEILQELI